MAIYAAISLGGMEAHMQKYAVKGQRKHSNNIAES